MWKPEHRATADRRGLRYESDLTDAEWALVAPLIRPAKRGGRPRTVNVREVLNAIFYVLDSGFAMELRARCFNFANGFGDGISTSNVTLSWWGRDTVAERV